ncbi:MAG: 30S ribosomal protein S9 [Nanoarchaeota archaeon]|nr:30S ribosomal protein S9 [Nanoarchaeota archaeon]
MSKVVHVSGKRKKAIARATLKEGSGIIKINKILLSNYSNNLARLKIQEPLTIAEELANKVNIIVSVKGGGWQSQAEAARLAIAKALVGFSRGEKLKKAFLDYDRHLLIADVRKNEVCKPNDSGKPRKHRQKSYR